MEKTSLLARTYSLCGKNSNCYSRHGLKVRASWWDKLSKKDAKIWGKKLKKMGCSDEKTNNK
jgi:hypothetical protein